MHVLSECYPRKMIVCVGFRLTSLSRNDCGAGQDLFLSCHKSTNLLPDPMFLNAKGTLCDKTVDIREDIQRPGNLIDER